MASLSVVRIVFGSFRTRGRLRQRLRRQSDGTVGRHQRKTGSGVTSLEGNGVVTVDLPDEPAVPEIVLGRFCVQAHVDAIACVALSHR